MKNGIYLIGAGGHARSLINTLELCSFKIDGIYDDNFRSDEEVNSYALTGKVKDIMPEDTLVLAVGDSVKRSALFSKYQKQICKKNIIHPSAIIEKRAIIGRSNQILARTYINSNVTMGDNNILNTGSILEHEAIVGSHNHISVGTVICGRVKVSDRCFIGAGAVIIDKAKICDDVIIGANSVVIGDIDRPGTYAGNPARRIK